MPKKKASKKKITKKAVPKKSVPKKTVPKKTSNTARKKSATKKVAPKPVIKLPLKDDALKLAIANIANFGDTDVFPFPLENLWFYDDPASVLVELQRFRDMGESAFQTLPVYSTTELSNSGFLGYRPATQIDPLWNACFLASAIQVAPAIELQRQPDNRVFSYRFDPDASSGKLFADTGYKDFHLRGLELAKEFSHVALVDISDFYPRIYHHRLENALATDCGCDGSVVKFIDKFLSKVNTGNSFGLPVGGPAARILAEAVLNRTDKLLRTRRVEFLRFVDDYMIFGNSENETRSAVLEASRALLDNEGLSLNRNKTRLLTADEFRRQSVFAESEAAESSDESEKKRFYSIHLRFDPYSSTAEEDYEKLAKTVREFDLLGMLERELVKSRADRFALAQLIKALRFMDEEQRSDAVATLAANLENTFPIFSTVAIAFKQVREEISDEAANLFYAKIRELIEGNSPLLAASGTLAFAVRVLADDPSQEADIALQHIYSQMMLTPIVEREVILAMAHRKASYWVSDLRSRHTTISNPWAIRALLAGSYSLRDEGKHWREAVKRNLQPHDAAYLKWLSSKFSSNPNWEIPL